MPILAEGARELDVTLGVSVEYVEQLMDRKEKGTVDMEMGQSGSGPNRELIGDTGKGEMT